MLSQAENERMHLLTFLALKQPGPLFRGVVLLGQVSGLCQQHLLSSLPDLERAVHSRLGQVTL